MKNLTARSISVFLLLILAVVLCPALSCAPVSTPPTAAPPPAQAVTAPAPEPEPVLPDLYVADCSLKLGEGLDDSAFTVDIGITGTGIESVLVNIFIDWNKPFASQTVAFQSGNTAGFSPVSLADVLKKFPEVKLGEHTFDIVVDPSNANRESNERNNEYSIAFTIPADFFVPKLPDLVASYVKRTDDKKSVVVGFENSGVKPAGAFSVGLSINGIPYAEWMVDGLAVGAKGEKSFSLEDVIKWAWEKTDLRPGEHDFQLNVDTGNSVSEIDEIGNNRTTGKIAIARAPLERQAPQSELERKINESFDNFTVYTTANQQEAIDMAVQGPLNPVIDAGLDMSRVTIRILNYDDFGKEYLKTFGINFGGELTAGGLMRGNQGSQEVLIREGLLPQVLPALVREVSGAFYLQKNRSSWNSGASVRAHEFYVTLAEAAGVSWLFENCGWAANTNISYKTGVSKVGSITSQSDIGIDLRRVLAVANSLGYPEKTVSSADLFQKCFQIVKMSDPTSYAVSLDGKAAGLDLAGIQLNLRRAQMVDKEPVTLSSDVVKKIAPYYSHTATLDAVWGNQNGAALAFSLSAK